MQVAQFWGSSLRLEAKGSADLAKPHEARHGLDMRATSRGKLSADFAFPVGLVGPVLLPP
jgi:hypothetical protein